jgi:hypothetical protein
VARFAAIALVLSTGCQQLFGLDEPRVLDASVSVDDSQSENCVGTGLVTFCAPPAAVPTNLFDITPGNTLTIDPTQATLCLQETLAGVATCVIPAKDVSISGTLRVVGPYPVVIAAFGQVTVNGTLDVSSNTTAGAGSVSAGCGNVGSAGALLNGGGGGGGGSFGTGGAVGGTGGSSTATGGSPGPIQFTVALRGGCSGGNGGSGGDGPVGTGGLGGGAVYIAAKTSIDVQGTINASGGPGGGGGKRAGGGAGGSGGLIGFDAPVVTLGASAAIFANGGGGGEGGESGNPGAPGAVSAGPLDRAVGGDSATKAGAGGQGSLGEDTGTAGLNTQDNAAGGGGGGGGGGMILIYAQSVSNQGLLSPPPRPRT